MLLEVNSLDSLLEEKYRGHMSYFCSDPEV
jgi:hypothetical protein